MIRPNNNYTILRTNSADVDVDYSVTLRITDACDLKCSYCHWHSGPQYAYDDIVVCVDRLFEFFVKQQFKSVLFYYHGGEPTRHKRIVDILKYIKDKGVEHNIRVYNEVQTNLTLRVKLLDEVLPHCDMLDVSFHYMELATRGGGFKLDDFDRNFNHLRLNGVAIHNFDVMLEDMSEGDVEEFYSRVERYLSYSHIKHSEMIYGYYKHSTNTERHIQFYEKHNKSEQLYNIDGKQYNTNELFANGLDCRGWKCDAGKRTIYVNGDGNVFVCGEPATQTLKGIPLNVFTNLITDNMWLTKMCIIQSAGVVCKWEVCGGDYYVPKYKR